jgi:hypothetical protein
MGVEIAYIPNLSCEHEGTLTFVPKSKAQDCRNRLEAMGVHSFKICSASPRLAALQLKGLITRDQARATGANVLK